MKTILLLTSMLIIGSISSAEDKEFHNQLISEINIPADAEVRRIFDDQSILVATDFYDSGETKFQRIDKKGSKIFELMESYSSKVSKNYILSMNDDPSDNVNSLIRVHDVNTGAMLAEIFGEKDIESIRVTECAKDLVCFKWGTGDGKRVFKIFRVSTKKIVREFVLRSNATLEREVEQVRSINPSASILGGEDAFWECDFAKCSQESSPFLQISVLPNGQYNREFNLLYNLTTDRIVAKSLNPNRKIAYFLPKLIAFVLTDGTVTKGLSYDPALKLYGRTNDYIKSNNGNFVWGQEYNPSSGSVERGISLLNMNSGESSFPYIRNSGIQGWELVLLLISDEKSHVVFAEAIDGKNNYFLAKASKNNKNYFKDIVLDLTKYAENDSGGTNALRQNIGNDFFVIGTAIVSFSEEKVVFEASPLETIVHIDSIKREVIVLLYSSDYQTELKLKTYKF